jgi:hypothetical protein
MDKIRFRICEDSTMVSAVSVASSPSVLAPSQSQSQAKSAATSFQQAIDQYSQDPTSSTGSTSAGPSQTLSSDMMSSLLQMQS